MAIDIGNPETDELLRRYEKWRWICHYAGRPPWDESDREDGRLHFRFGYPHTEWWGYVIEAEESGIYRVLRLSTERRTTPAETSQGVFSRLQDAGKFVIYKVGTYLRSELRMEMIGPKWNAAGLDPDVAAHTENDQIVKYELRSDPTAYFIMARGDMPYSHLLPLSYDGLDAVLLDGFPESVTSRLRADRPD
jgi:hypothetical protein